MAASVAICLAAFVWLVWTLRRDRLSLGLPIAYLFGLLLIHVPGAIAQIVGGDVLHFPEYTEIGIRFTAIGAVCFVLGAWIARFGKPNASASASASTQGYWTFCLLGGWLFTYGLSFLGRVPSVGAAVEKGGAVWMLGVMLALRAAVKRGDPMAIAIWLSALAVYPTLMLLLGGFLSYGATASIIVLSVLVVSIRSHWRAAAGLMVATVLGFNLFLSYFEIRKELRDVVWGGASMSERVEVAEKIVQDFEWFDPSNERQLIAIDQRLNQNFFVGLAATRIEEGQADYLHGRSLWEGLLALVPRALWPDKPVYAGSPGIVMEMTGLLLPETTSFGVGNVMEFHINYGIAGLVVGFLALGCVIGSLDRRAAIAEATGNLDRVFLYFLPAVALIQPNGSMVELVSGSAAALAAAFGWSWLWRQWSRRGTRSALRRNVVGHTGRT